jgi:hypothetical protein
MEIYRRLRDDLAEPELETLKIAVRAHYEQLVRAQQRDELVSIDLAELLCLRLEGLLAMAQKFEPESRGHVVGAARYFVSHIDAIPDERSCTGLDDDVEVFNHVVGIIGRPDLLITE